MTSCCKDCSEFSWRGRPHSVNSSPETTYWRDGIELLHYQIFDYTFATCWRVIHWGVRFSIKGEIRSMNVILDDGGAMFYSNLARS